MNKSRLFIFVQDEMQQRYNAAMRTLAEIRNLNARALGVELAGDPFDMAVLQASRPWLDGWADYFDGALRTLRQRERLVETDAGEREIAADGVVVPFPCSRLEAGVQVRRLLRLLKEAHAFALCSDFAECDHFGVAEMTGNLIHFFASVEGLGAIEPARVEPAV